MKNFHEKKYAKKVEWIRGYAKYCSKHGRSEQAIVLYQKALKISATGNLLKEYLELKDELVKMNQDKEELSRTYFNGIKQKRIIDPSDDRELDDILQSLQDSYVGPYTNEDR